MRYKLEIANLASKRLLILAMDFSQLNRQYSPQTPFIKPHVAVAPRQIIGFEISPKSEIKPSEGELNQCLEVQQGKFSSNYRGATSPRSALQELLLKSPGQSETANSSISANQNGGMSSAEKQSAFGQINQQLNDELELSKIQSRGNHEATAVLALRRTRAVGFAAVLEDPRRRVTEAKLNSTSDLTSPLGLSGIKDKLNSVKEVIIDPPSACRKGSNKSKKSSLFMFVVHSSAIDHDHNINRSTDFLDSCRLCRSRLKQGQDVFMYNGDNAFCSMECRYEQIVIDERKERWPPAVIRAGADTVNGYDSIAIAHQHTHSHHVVSKTHNYAAPSLRANNTAAAA